MTFTEKAIALLVENGMFDNQAIEVVKIMKVGKENEAMQYRWNDDMEGYPPMQDILWFMVRHAAIIYIDLNCPKAWYRPLFADS